jgi:hypothetical protein
MTASAASLRGLGRAYKQEKIAAGTETNLPGWRRRFALTAIILTACIAAFNDTYVCESGLGCEAIACETRFR